MERVVNIEKAFQQLHKSIHAFMGVVSLVIYGCISLLYFQLASHKSASFRSSSTPRTPKIEILFYELFAIRKFGIEKYGTSSDNRVSFLLSLTMNQTNKHAAKPWTNQRSRKQRTISRLYDVRFATPTKTNK